MLGGIPMKEAIGTSLLIITFKSATGFLGYLTQVNIGCTFSMFEIFLNWKSYGCFAFFSNFYRQNYLKQPIQILPHLANS